MFRDLFQAFDVVFVCHGVHACVEIQRMDESFVVARVEVNHRFINQLWILFAQRNSARKAFLRESQMPILFDPNLY